MMRAKELAGDDVVVRDDVGLLTTLADGELIGMSIEKGSCYGFNRVGTRVWALLAEPRSVDTLCEELLSEFAVEEAVCRRQVIEFIEELRTEGLVTLRSK